MGEVMYIYQYLAKIINKQLNGEKYEIDETGLDFDQLVDIAKRNHIVYIVFSELIGAKSISDEQRDYLRSAIKRSILTTLMQTSEIKSLSDSFEKNGVKNIFLKGSILKNIYPRPEIREMSDIDILIDEEDMEKAQALLTSIGYKLHESIKHHDIYYKAPYLVLEAHRALYDKTVDSNQYSFFLDLTNRKMKNNCEYSYEFSKEDFYVYMLAHAAKHFYAMGCGIRNLIDVYVYLSKYKNSMDMDEVNQKLEKCGIKSFAQHMEKLAFDWLEEKELDEFYESLFQYMLDSGIYGKDENGIWNKFAYVEKNCVSRFELKRWYYFPPLYYMSEYYPWLDRHPHMLPIAWVVRLFKGLIHKKGVKKRKMVHDIKCDQIMTYNKIYKAMNLTFTSK